MGRGKKVEELEVEELRVRNVAYYYPALNRLVLKKVYERVRRGSSGEGEKVVERRILYGSYGMVRELEVVEREGSVSLTFDNMLRGKREQVEVDEFNEVFLETADVSEE